MDETRVSRYQEYRQSFIKEGSIVSSEDAGGDLSSTTSTLPIDEVITTVKEEERKVDLDKKAKRRHVIGIIVKVSIAVLVVAGLIILGIFAWRK